MNKNMFILSVMAALVLCGIANYAYGADESEPMAQGAFDGIYEVAPQKDGVKAVSYDQFVKIRNSGEKYFLLDVLPPESYAKGHIEGASSFPMETINKDSAEKMMPKGSSVITYCASFKCTASSQSAKTLSSLGYKALAYEGGLKEWQEKGNGLVK